MKKHLLSWVRNIWKKGTCNIYTQKEQKGTNLLEILHWFLCCGDKHFEVIGAVFNFNDSFDDLVITREKKVLDYKI